MKMSSSAYLPSYHRIHQLHVPGKPNLTASRMLRHLRNAAQPTTQLYIVDMILPLACVDTTEVAEPIPGAVRSLAPEGSPLLANLGKASANGYLLDLSVRPPSFHSTASTGLELTM